jgi:hypothetical protein
VAERALLKQLHAEWVAQTRRLADETPAFLASRHPPFPATPLALYAQLEGRLEAWRVLRARPLTEFADRYATSAWTVKDMLGHLATWAAEFRRQIETVTRGESFDYTIPFALSVMGPNEWNNRQAAAQRGVPLESLLDSFEAHTRWMQDLVLALPESALYGEVRLPLSPSGDPKALLTGSIAMLVLGKCQHDAYHTDRLAALLERWTR